LSAKITKTFNTLTYTIKLPQFEGPFDLLLFFIERDELDIYDIPVAKITNDFLDYIRHLESLNIDIASEFILVAATLMRIKAKMLLPRKDLDEEGNEIDPRQELVQKLLEYKSYKEIFADLQLFEAERQRKVQRGNILVEMQVIANQAMADAELENLSLFKLLKTYQDILRRFSEREEKIVHTIVHYNYTLEERREFIIAFVFENQQVDALQLLSKCENRMHAIFTFLALLDLLQQEIISIVIHSQNSNDFLLIAAPPKEEIVQTELELE
jgi:segregation and condensation protein A